MRGLAPLLLAALAFGPCGAQAPPGLIPVRFGKATLLCEVARSEAERAHGLMDRDSLPSDRGMLFVFEAAAPLSFWMKDTRLPLSIAFLDAQKRVLNIDRMRPFDDQTLHRSKGDALYAVEANEGWFESRGIKPGDRVDFQE